MGEILRRASRAVLATDALEVLLVKFQLPTGQLWAIPGGGVESGEDDISAVLRELEEEVGVVPSTLVGPIWSRTVEAPDGHVQSERYFYARVPKAPIRPKFSPQALQEESIVDAAWWSFEKIRDSNEFFAPSRLRFLLADLFQYGPPRSIIRTEP